MLESLNIPIDQLPTVFESTSINNNIPIYNIMLPIRRDSGGGRSSHPLLRELFHFLLTAALRLAAAAAAAELFIY